MSRFSVPEEKEKRAIGRLEKKPSLPILPPIQMKENNIYE